MHRSEREAYATSLSVASFDSTPSFSSEGILAKRRPGTKDQLRSDTDLRVYDTVVWSRFQHAHLQELQGHSQRYVQALRKQRAARLKASSEPFGRFPRPGSWT